MSDTKILVVDDESSIMVLCQHLLELSDYTVFPTSSPADAVEILEKQKIDLLLTDIRLPEMDGFDLAKSAQKLQPGIAVVVMTGYRTVETAIRALRSGVDGLVIKPYELGPELLDVVKQALAAGQKKQDAVALAELQPLLRLSGAALVETPPAAVEKLAGECLRELLKTGLAGIYRWPAGKAALEAVSGGEGLPGASDPFWKSAPLLKMLAGEGVQRLLVTTYAQPDADAWLKQCHWSSLALVVIKHRKEQIIFAAARGEEEPPLLRRDLDLLAALAHQTVASLENSRLFHRLAGFARRVEEDGSLLESAERVSLMGSLMPALTHEINNPLQAVKSNLYLAGRGGQPQERLQGYLGTAQKELYRLEVLLQRILALAQPACGEESALDVEQLIVRTLEVFQLRLKEQNIQVKLAAARPVGAVCGVRGQLELALYSLIENAVQALEGQDGEKVIWVDIGQNDRNLQILVEDAGPGIAEAAGADLFKPFNSSRAEGSGLGLAVSRRIIEAHGGRLVRAQARHGQGLCLKIVLPAAK